MNIRFILKGIGLWLLSNFIVTMACGGLFKLAPERVLMFGLFNVGFGILTGIWCFRIARYGSAVPPQEAMSPSTTDKK